MNKKYIGQIQTLTHLDNDSLILLYDSQPKDSPFTYAKIIPISINTKENGLWINNIDSTFSWIIGFESKTAFSLSVLLKNVNLPEGAKLFCINKEHKIINGPYTSKHKNDNFEMFIEPIPGDEIYIELDLPLSVNSNINYFKIDGIGHDFRNFFNNTNNKRGASGSCEHDINCGIGLDWQKEKRSVVKYTYPANGRLPSCTGTLINNTANNELPYILTANHCIKDANTASLAVFYFNYENSTCGTSNASYTSSISGAKLIATSKDSSAKLDFTLLLLKKTVPDEFNPYYAGWSLSKETDNKVVAIHHPKGDPKKISYENDFIKNSSFTLGGYMSNSHWQISKWDTGSTEGGSSGCPLFNQNHQIIGTLSGGDANCDNPANDYFQKLYKSWDYFSDSIYQLKHWLDPINLNITECQPYDPKVGSSNPVTNIQLNEELKHYTFGNKASGFWSGYNEPGFKYLADKFSGIKNEFIYAIKFPISYKEGMSLNKIKLIIWDGFEHPENIIYEHYLSQDSVVNKKYYCLRFPKPLNAKNDYFIGFELSNISSSDSITFFTSEDRADKSTSLFYYYQDKWLSSKELGYNASLGMEVYVTDSVNKIRQITRIPEKLLNIDYSSKDSLQTKELFGVDSISNYNETDWLQIHYLTNGQGIWSGTNEYKTNMFAENYVNTQNSYLSAIKIAVAKKHISVPNAIINLYIMNGNKTPDSIICKLNIPLDSIQENYFNIYKLPKYIKPDSNYFVVLETNNIFLPDTFALYMGNTKNSENRTHSFFKNSDIWFNYFMYDISEHLGLSVETVSSPYVYSKNRNNYKYKIQNTIKPPSTIFKSVFIYPNPVEKSKEFISLNFGNFFTKNVIVNVYDLFGRIVLKPEIDFDVLNNIKMDIKSLQSGLYYVKVKIEDNELKAIPLIIL